MSKQSDYYNRGESGVIVGSCALAMNGLTTVGGWYLTLATKYKEIDNFQLATKSYHYLPEIDKINYIKPTNFNPNLLLPSAERALAECIKNLDIIIEGELLEAIDTYLLFNDNNDDELRKVCNFYGVTDDVLDYWIEESKDYTGA